MPAMWIDVDAAVTVPVNIAALIDDTDFKTREESVTFDQAGLDLLWNFETTAGVITQTAVTPTNTGGVYDWTNVGNAMYKIEIPASGGGTINNDTEGFGWFSGFATGILPWIGPMIGFRAAALNDLLVDANGLDVKLDRNMDLTQHLRGFHTHQGNTYYVKPVNGNDSTGDGSRALPYKTLQNAIIDLITSGNHDTIIVLADASPGVTTHTSTTAIACNKRYFSILGPGRDLIITRSNNGPTFQITADGIEISGFQLGSDGASATSSGVDIVAVDFHRIHNIWFLDTQGDGIHCGRGSNCHFHNNHFEGTGIAASGQGIHISGAGGAGNANDNEIYNNHFAGTVGTAILIDDGTTDDTAIYDNTIHNAGGWGIDITVSSDDAQVHDNILGNNASGNIRSADPTAIIRNNTEWLSPTVETTVANAQRTIDVTATGASGIDWANVENKGATVALTATDINNVAGDVQGRLASDGLGNVTAWTVNITGSLSGSVGSVSGNVGGNISGNVEGSVAVVTALASGAIVVGAFVTDSITAAAVSAGAVTKIQSGLATSTALTTHDGKLDTVDTVVDAILVDTGTTLPTTLAAIQADLPNTITKNVALADFPFFMVLTSDHVTGATGKSVTAQRSLDGEAFANAANAVVEISGGVYKIDLAATDLNADTVCLKFTAADCDARIITIVTKPT